MFRPAHRWTLGALAALALACPGSAAAAPVTGAAIGLTPTTAVVTATFAGDTSRVSYGTSSTYGSTMGADNAVSEYTLTGLAPNTTYHYRAEVPGLGGTWIAGADRTFTTRPAGAPEMGNRPAAFADTSSMSCYPGTWTSGSIVTKVAWLDGGVANGATGSSFTPDHVGFFACQVTVSKGASTSFMSSPSVGFVPPPPVPSGATITGTPQAGATLTCDKGGWSGATSWTYSWQRDTTDIDGESASTYVVTAADVGHDINCAVRGTGPGGSVVTRASSVTATPGVIVEPAIVAPHAAISGPGVATATAPVLVSPIDSSSSSSSLDDGDARGAVSAVSALRTMLAGRVPTRRALVRRGGATLRFRPPAPLGMLRVKLVPAGAESPVLAVGARWYDTVRSGVVRLRLTQSGRRALKASRPIEVDLVATFVPDHGRIESDSRTLTLRP